MFDNHAHVVQENTVTAYIANIVTGVSAFTALGIDEIQPSMSDIQSVCMIICAISSLIVLLKMR